MLSASVPVQRGDAEVYRGRGLVISRGHELGLRSGYDAGFTAPASLQKSERVWLGVAGLARAGGFTVCLALCHSHQIVVTKE